MSTSSPSSSPYYLITGAASGVGFETACTLASSHYSVIVTARSQAKADDAVRRIQRRFPSKPLTLLAMPLDLCNLSSIEALAAALTDRQLPLRCLICNAGATKTNEDKIWGTARSVGQQLLRSLPPRETPHAQTTEDLAQLSGDVSSTAQQRPRILLTTHLLSSPLIAQATVSASLRSPPLRGVALV